MNNYYLRNIIEEGKQNIRNSFDHHLPLSYRNKLLKTIKDEKVIGRLSILCALKVYSLWESYIPEELELLKLLQNAENFLNAEVSEEKLLTNAGKMKMYVENKNDEEHFSALYAGHSAVNAAFEVTGKDIDTENFDDYEIDSYDWDSAFYACLAYDGGASSLKNREPFKTKEFWEWYLEEGVKKAFSTEQLVFVNKTIDVKDSEFERNSLVIIINNQSINKKIDEISDLLINNIPTNQWDKIDLCVYVVNYTRLCEIYYYNKSEKAVYSVPFEISHKINSIIFSLKGETYNIIPKEGTFYRFQLIIDMKKDKTIQFIYDTNDDNLNKAFSDKDFAEDFKKYPRKIEFTPIWLQKILKREKVNINSFKWD